MIIHVVLFQPKPEVRREAIDLAFSHIQALQKSIPGIIDVQTGDNRSENHQGYTYGFVMRFATKDHLKAYAIHPAHRVVSDELVHMCDRIIDFDLEERETR